MPLTESTMRYFLLAASLALSTVVMGQICPSQPLDIPVTGWSQSFGADWSADSPYLDQLGMPEFGTGISDDNLAVVSNGAITGFLGVKFRSSIAPADNPTLSNGFYQVPTGYSAVSNSNSALSSNSTWNILAYLDLGELSFADVDVRLYIDFDPCFGTNEQSMFELNFSDLMALSNMDANEVSELATFQNLSSPAWTLFGDDNVLPFDAEASGFYTIALAVYDACGNQRLWHEIIVHASDSFDADANDNGIADELEVGGCMQLGACNYDCSASYSDGSCEFVSCSDCTIQEACNYNPDASVTNTSSCLFPSDLYGSDLVDCAGVCLADSDGDGICDADEILGCLDQSACNYNGSATDSGSCDYPTEIADCSGACWNDEDGDGICDENEVVGCVDSSACNFMAEATNDNGSCEYSTCAGCTVVQACNYDNQATITDTDSCVYPDDGYDCAGACLSDSDGDGICDLQEFVGCTDSAACNFSNSATDDDGSCNYPPAFRDCNNVCIADSNQNGICDEEEVFGCVDDWACNFSAEATSDDGTCEFLTCSGCMDEAACNYNDQALLPDFGACNYPAAHYNCDGSPMTDENANGIADELEVAGCTDSSATNYDPNATIHDDSCIGAIAGCLIPGLPNYDPAVTVQLMPVNDACGVIATGGAPTPLELVVNAGCTNVFACNFDENATEDNGSCEYASCVGCTNAAACDYDDNAIYNGGCSDYTSCYGCTEAAADNYNGTATLDDGSCVFNGCTHSLACNFEPIATSDDGTCEYASCSGCTNPQACNYDVAASLDNGLCDVPSGCESCENGESVDNDADNDGVCDADEIAGCMNLSACNFNAASTNPDGSCVFPSGCDSCSGEQDGTGTVLDGDANNNGTCDALEVEGCTNSTACNYDENATQSDGSCDFASCVGCMQVDACNYDPSAALNELLSCVFAAAGYDCDGDCLVDTDGDGVCDEFEVIGCMLEDACNFNEDATEASDDCTYPGAYENCAGDCLVDADGDGICDQLEVLGCENDQACNFNAEATESNGTCEFSSCAECGDVNACNYVAGALSYDLTLCTYAPEGYEDCAATICIDSDSDGNCDLEELPSCIGEFNPPSLEMSGVIDVSTSPEGWASEVFYTSTIDENDVDVQFMDFEGRLNDGLFAVTRVYVLTDVCGNTAEMAQLLRAVNQAEGCTYPAATNYDADAINDNGTCHFHPVCFGDLDLDGLVGSTDLLALLSVFALPCGQ